MKYKLIRHIFIACIIVFLLSFGFMLLMLSHTFHQQHLSELQNQAAFLSAAVNENGWAFLEHVETDNRTTLVSPNGSVLFDNEMPLEELDNHADREEIREAMESGVGESKRLSHTLAEQTVYYAVKLENGDILRISMEENSWLSVLLAMMQPMLLAMLLALGLSVLLASRFSQEIMKPINALDVENPDDRDIYDEMKPFIRRIVSQNQQIHAQMETLQEEHKKQDAMRREFTANVSHELKTPLTSISGFAEIIRNGMVQEKDIPHFADNIYQEAQRLMVLVNDILKLSRLEEGTGRLEAEREPVDLLVTCQNVQKRLEMTAKQAGITLTCGGDHDRIMGIPLMLEEIFYNLCDNAIKYNRAGGSVAMTVEAEADAVVVRVKDTGIGIPKEDQPRVFERFYRVNKSHSKEVGGTGLGLSIVKHGAAYHQAEITLESEEGVGTEISLRFRK